MCGVVEIKLFLKVGDFFWGGLKLFDYVFDLIGGWGVFGVIDVDN